MSMNATLGKKDCWGHYRFEQLALLCLFELHVFLFNSASRNRQLINLRTSRCFKLRMDPPIMFLKVASSL